MKRMKRSAILLAALAAVAAGMFWAVPPPPLSLTSSPAAGVRGAMHIHTKRSDGGGTPEEIAAAAARAGLQFVILTDHGNAMRTPLLPAYHSGVLVMDAVEISGDDGHVVALGLPKMTYPLGGEVRDIVEDVERAGGMSIAAHPGSPKPQLRWTEWTSPVSGLEWLNADSESRDEPWYAFPHVLLSYPFRPASSLAMMFDRPESVLRQWDALTARRRVVAVAGTDAHARLDVRGDESGGRLGMFPIPGYETMFRTFSLDVVGVTLTRDAERDSAAVIDGIRKGHVYSTIDALAAHGSVSFSAGRGGATWPMGEFVPPDGGDLELHVESNAPTGSTIVLFKNGAALTTATGRSLRHVVTGSPGVYRAEIQLARSPGNPPVPWVVTNPVYVRARDESPVPRAVATQTGSQYDNGEARGWRTETSPRSKAALDVVRTLTGTELLLRWALGGTMSESPYAALAMPAGEGIAGYDQLLFTARADRPMRISVQLRLPNGDRWRRSIYLDQMPRPITVFFDELRPAGATAESRLQVKNIRDVLFVVDTVNANPGMAGQFWIDDVKYGR